MFHRWLRFPASRHINKWSLVVTCVGLVLVCRYTGKQHESDGSIRRRFSNNVSEGTTFFTWSEELSDYVIGDSRKQPNGGPKESCVWPGDSCDVKSDRIVEQLLLREQSNKTFKIHIQREYNLPHGPDVFLSNNCQVNRCELSHDIDAADAIVFQNADVFREPNPERRSEQVWIAYLLESPVNTFDKRFERKFRGLHVFNWTASYRSDSDIVTPYSKFVPFATQLERYLALLRQLGRNHDKIYNSGYDDNILRSWEKKKTSAAKKVAWLVSNCRASNGRLEIAKKLSKYIQVDIFGSCGDRTCSKSNHTECLQYINDNYKFYLSFENSNCNEYITEKLYQNALGYNDLNHMLVPIVMGAPKEDYIRLSPPNSFIHVDDFESLKDLANYLNLLDREESLYLDYFRWKTTGRFIDTRFLCRLCAMLHNSYLNGKQKSIPSVRDWWLKGSDLNQEQCSTSSHHL